MTGSAEARTLIVLVAALFALAVPAAAAFPGEASEAAAGASPAPHAAATLGLFENAPPPLIVMAIGVTIVLVTVVRRARKTGLGADAHRS